MNKDRFSIKNIPGWVYTLVIFGFLYLTGLHTEAIGQAQRVLLATGLIQPKLTEVPAATGANANVQTAASNATENDFLLQDLNGNTIKFSSLKNKVIFMNIWATWCPPCVAELPGIQSLYDKVKTNSNIAFVMLSVSDEDLAKTKRFLDKKGLNLPVYVPAGPIPAAFQTQSIPTTFILSKDGKIATQHNGMADYNTQKVQDYLTTLAK